METLHTICNHENSSLKLDFLLQTINTVQVQQIEELYFLIENKYNLLLAVSYCPIYIPLKINNTVEILLDCIPKQDWLTKLNAHYFCVHSKQGVTINIKIIKNFGCYIMYDYDLKHTITGSKFERDIYEKLVKKCK